MLGRAFQLLAERGLVCLPEFLAALAIGLLIGLERERNRTAKAGPQEISWFFLSRQPV